MQDRRLFSRNALTGITEWFTYDEDTDQVYMTAEQDVTRLTDVNVAAQNEVAERSMKWGEFAHVATIPMSIYAEWLLKGRDKDPDFIKRWLNDRDNRKFRVRLGRV